MTQDEFTKLFLAITEVKDRLVRIEENKADKSDIDRLHTTLDGIAGRFDIDDTERLALTAQVDRHENWIERAAPSTGVSYDPSA